ncbi:MAG: acylamino-acid-releasing enzyme [Hyphomonadaceae bacterium]|nr:MAG: acylamino-acid-releasing enzyme [Hyphomonadaceae bacterium]
MDDDGTTISRIDFDYDRKISKVYVRNGSDWREVLSESDTPLPAFSFVGLNANGQPLIWRNYGSNFGAIEAINMETGAITDVVKSNDTPIDGTIENPWNGHFIGVNMGGIQPVTRWLEPKLQQIQTTLDARFPNKTVNIVNFSQDMNKIIIAIGSDTIPTAYFVYDATTTRLLSIGATMPTLNNVAMGPVFTMMYKSRDGVDIPVYVTVPPNIEDPTNLPTIIFPHGGPEARDEPYFNWWAQFMASRGYLVIQPQFRGSSGFGRAFADAGRRQWGKRMQDDVSDALAWAVREGYTNPRRTCIVGASYGGYVALQAATASPDLFQCVVSFAGISDLGEMINIDGNNYWRDHIGPYDRDAMEFGSPRRHIETIKAPILLLHGRDDTVVDFHQSEAMADALRRVGKPFKLVEMRHGDHWLSLGPTRLQTLEEIEKFLEEHIGASATQH